MANPILAAILSFLIPGLGQFYCGSLAKGLAFLVVAILLGLAVLMVFKSWVYIIINLLISLYAAYDAYNMASLK